MSTLSKFISYKPGPINVYANIHVSDSSHLLMVPHLHFDLSSKSECYLWKFNISQNKWIKWFKYPENYKFAWCTSALNDDKTKLYIFGSPGYLITVNLKTGEFIESKQFHDGAYSVSLFVNGQFHVFGGWKNENKAHYIWDEVKQDLNESHKFEEMKDILALNNWSYNTCAVYSKSQNSVFFSNDAAKLYSYCLTKQQCIPLNIKDEKMSIEGIIMTSDERFIICFISGLPNEIQLIDLKTMKFRKCNYILPQINFQAMCLKTNYFETEIITSGFIRIYLNESECPTDIVRMIAMFFVMDIIYVLFNSIIYGLNVDDIIDSLEC